MQKLDVAIPNGIPIVYKFDKQIQPIPPPKEKHSVSQIHMNGLFLEKPGILKEALKREDEWARAVPGYDSTMSRHNRPMTSLERSLYKLNATRELGEWASEFIDTDAPVEDDGSDGNFGKPMVFSEDEVWEKGMEELANGNQMEGESDLRPLLDVDDDDDDQEVVPKFFTQPCSMPMPSTVVLNDGGSVPIRRDSVIVIIRHGKTQHNKLGLFTGWVS